MINESGFYKNVKLLFFHHKNNHLNFCLTSPLYSTWVNCWGKKCNIYFSEMIRTRTVEEEMLNFRNHEHLKEGQFKSNILRSTKVSFIENLSTVPLIRILKCTFRMQKSFLLESKLPEVSIKKPHFRNQCWTPEHSWPEYRCLGL